MKKISSICVPAFLIAILLCSVQCKKNKPSNPTVKDSSYITLHDKSLSIIQSHIQGKWQLQYEQGSNFAGTFPQTDFFWEFNLNNNVRETYQSNLIVDTAINWVRTKDVFADSTYLMTFSDIQGVPWVYIVDGVYNDTLVLYDNASDFTTYHFTKTN
jgi:hypothetical protein